MSRKVLEALLVPMLALPGHLSAGEIDDATLAREVETYVQGLVAADEFSGAVMVARGEDVVFQGPLVSRAAHLGMAVGAREILSQLYTSAA